MSYFPALMGKCPEIEIKYERQIDEMKRGVFNRMKIGETERQRDVIKTYHENF